MFVHLQWELLYAEREPTLFFFVNTRNNVCWLGVFRTDVKGPVATGGLGFPQQATTSAPAYTTSYRLTRTATMVQIRYIVIESSEEAVNSMQIRRFVLFRKDILIPAFS